MEIEFPTRFSIKSEIIKEETFSFSEIFEGYPNDELKLEPVECKTEPLDEINESQFGIEQSDLQDINYRCDFCPYTATQQRYIRRHQKRHVEKAKFVCNVCGYESFEKKDLTRHSMVHSDEKLYSCSICPFKCKKQSYLNKFHMKTHADRMSSDQYFCNDCNFRTPWRSSLTAHLKIHKNDRPFQCNVCLNRFVGKGDLKKHLMIHSKDKPYHCTDCNYKAARSYHLKIHREAHERRKQVKNLN